MSSHVVQYVCIWQCLCVKVCVYMRKRKVRQRGKTGYRMADRGSVAHVLRVCVCEDRCNVFNKHNPEGTSGVAR